MKDTLKECITHGQTNHRVFKEGLIIRIRCRKCIVDAVSRRRRRIKVLAVEYKGGKCNRCEYSKSIAALEFHHRDPNEKDFAIGGKGITRSMAAIKMELDKCDLLCANCHREEHARLDDNFIGDSIDDILNELFESINT